MRWETTEMKVREYIAKDLEIDESQMSIERAHRLPSNQKPQPVIAKFSFFKDKEKVLRTYRQKRKESNEKEEQKTRAAQGGSDDVFDGDEDDTEETFRKDITISEDFPSRVMKARNDLRSFLKSALANKKKAYLKFDKLVIDDQQYEYDVDSEDIVPVTVDK